MVTEDFTLGFLCGIVTMLVPIVWMGFEHHRQLEELIKCLHHE